MPALWCCATRISLSKFNFHNKSEEEQLSSVVVEIVGHSVAKNPLLEHSVESMSFGMQQFPSYDTMFIASTKRFKIATSIKPPAHI
jgi:hypothetical protein